ncbi:MAG: DUF4158 domain-containing protein [Chloroflexota bacterium]|nr:DUF4158 domain-containing protein [Chloroflexota bacterium]
MPVRYLSDPELDRLSSWQGEIAEQDAVTFFTLTGDDLGWVRGFNRDENRLGVAVQLCTLPWLGWIPDDLAGCPSAACGRLAAALGAVERRRPGIWAAIPMLSRPAPSSSPDNGHSQAHPAPIDA